MARFHGRVGYGTSVETSSGSGVWDDVITERAYYGDVIRDVRNRQPAEDITPKLSVSNQISILADAYADDHFFAIKYVEWAGALWTVTNVEVQRPRLLLTLGEVYHGPVAA